VTDKKGSLALLEAVNMRYKVMVHGPFLGHVVQLMMTYIYIVQLIYKMISGHKVELMMKYTYIYICWLIKSFG
jgi:hypothetical protein